MTESTEQKITVNDGKGFYDNVGLIDSLIVDCNNAVKEIATGQYIAWCNQMVHMVQKLANLKQGVQNDINSLKEQVADLQRANDHLMDQFNKYPIERNGDTDE